MYVRPAFALPIILPIIVSMAVLAGCSAGTEQVATDNPVVQAPSASPAVTSSAAPSIAPTPAPPAIRIIEVAYTGGKVVTADSRVQTTLGEKIILRISSDVAEQIHVHGYDVYADVPAGGSVDVALTMTLSGGYQVELHEAGRPLLQLRTS